MPSRRTSNPVSTARSTSRSPTRGPLPPDEDGYDLWLRYRPLAPDARRALKRQATAVWWPGKGSPTRQVALAELQRAFTGLLGEALPVLSDPESLAAGTLLLATPRAWPALAALGLPAETLATLRQTLTGTLGREGYLLRSLALGRRRITLIAANSDIGLLYGTFAWLRALQTGADLSALDQPSSPAVQWRMLNHWDNLDRTVERGYAGQSIWDWWKLPHIVDARYTDYARACASLGLNGVSLNNVNAKAEMLSADWLAKAAALATVFRPYGLRVFLSVRFSSPVELGGLPNADPLEPAVQRWWADKVDEVYRLIPDFGGFLVKANSEGQPGPQDYGRSHAEGANPIARALAPHGGVLMWRAFVYAADNPQDRAKQAYDEFKPLDGQFEPNVIVQVKNGAIDFQPREPFHPLFGAMQQTPLMAEFMVTKEYLGFSTHLAYQGTLYAETLASETHRPQAGSTVAQTLRARGDGRPSGIAGVANVGSDRNWCGAHFEQANWYAYGRLAWQPDASPQALADEWARQTFAVTGTALRRVVSLMMDSREAVVNYMTPLGLHHLMATGHHHGPGPWIDNLKRPEWNPTYYHQADRNGIGFDRSASGSNAIAQYAAPLAATWGRTATTPDELRLWFHHVPWQHRMHSGRSLWHELITRYDGGVAAVAEMQRSWTSLRSSIDARRHHEVASHLAQQLREAQWWRDACIAYFQSVSGLALPRGVAAPAQTLQQYRALCFMHAPGCGG